MQKRIWLYLCIAGLVTAVTFNQITAAYLPEERVVVLRFMLFVWSGLVALILPHLTFPHRDSGLLQLLNQPPGQLLRTYLSTHWSFLIVSAAAVTGLSLSGIRFHPDLFFTGVLFLGGLYLIAAIEYLKIGSSSQAWKERAASSKAGLKFQQTLTQSQIQPGAFPSLRVSVTIAGTGMAACVVGAAVSPLLSGYGDLVMALILMVIGLGMMVIRQQSTDRFFYRTNAFFGEFFQSAREGNAERESLKLDQLWWIPARWRVHSWAIMLQQERRLPAGRMIAAGHAMLWIFAWLNADPTLYFIYWSLFALAHHGLLFTTVSQEFIPEWWEHHMDTSFHWLLARFWSQTRWLLPLISSLSAVNLMFGFFAWQQVGWLVAGYLMSAILFSALAGFNRSRGLVKRDTTN